MISYLGQSRLLQGQEQEQGGGRYLAHVIPESKHPLAYGICVAGDRGLLITRGDDSRATRGPHQRSP